MCCIHGCVHVAIKGVSMHLLRVAQTGSTTTVSSNGAIRYCYIESAHATTIKSVYGTLFIVFCWFVFLFISFASIYHVPSTGMVRRKVLVLDLDETLIHSHHDGIVRPMVKPGTPPDFVLRVGSVWILLINYGNYRLSLTNIRLDSLFTNDHMLIIFCLL